MIFYKESKNFLSVDNKKFIEETISSGYFPFYIQNFTTVKNNVKDNCLSLVHILLHRPESIDKDKRINSNYYEGFLNIVNSFFKKFKIKPKSILRMSVNFTFNNGFQKCPVHEDHNYPHKQLIIYLNDADPSSKTIVLDKKNKILKKIIPEKYKGVCFNNLPHYQFFPKKGERLVLVTTFI